MSAVASITITAPVVEMQHARSLLKSALTEVERAIARKIRLETLEMILEDQNGEAPSE